MKRVLSTVLIAGALALCACSPSDSAVETDNSSATDTQSPVVKQWVGKGSIITDPFTIDSESWVVEWAHVPARLKGNSIGSLQIIAYNVEDPDTPVAIVATSMEQENGTCPINGAGTFQLMINAANTHWAVKVIVPE